jgi:hypothetical protein
VKLLFGNRHDRRVQTWAYTLDLNFPSVCDYEYGMDVRLKFTKTIISLKCNNVSTSSIVDLRSVPYYYKKPSVFKLIQLFNSENLKAMYNLGKYLSLATKLRNDVSC